MYRSLFISCLCSDLEKKKYSIKRDLPSGKGLFLFSEKFELLPRSIGGYNFSGREYLHHTKLFVGNAQYAHLALWWEKHFYPFYMHLGIFTAGAVAHINGELKHGEAVAQKFLAEVGVGFPLFLGIGRQVKKHKYPHDTVFAETVEISVHISG